MTDQNKKDKTINNITLTLGAFGIACILYVVASNLYKAHQRSLFGNLDCVKENQSVTVNDDFMASRFKKGEAVTVAINFYNCNEVKRNDLVLFQFSEQIAPVLRIVRGLPGDHYALEPSPDDKQKWGLAINGEKILAPDGKPFLLSSESVPPLKTYELSRRGVLMPDEYIILATEPPGLSDSTNLGLIHKASLIGRVSNK